MSMGNNPEQTNIVFRDQSEGMSAGWYVYTDYGEVGPFADKAEACMFLYKDTDIYEDEDLECLDDQYLSQVMQRDEPPKGSVE